jgi:hypothetical protein
VIETGKVKPETIFDGEVINGFQKRGGITNQSFSISEPAF